MAFFDETYRVSRAMKTRFSVGSAREGTVQGLEGYGMVGALCP